MMRHIRVEYNLNTDLGPRHTEPRHNNSQIDRAISLQLKAIAAHSPLIRTFGLKLISGPINGGDRLKDALTGVTLTGPALGDLAAKVHDHLSISSIANKFWADEEGTEAFHDIRLAVAADDCWETQGFLLPETLPRGVTEISGEVWLCNIGVREVPRMAVSWRMLSESGSWPVLGVKRRHLTVRSSAFLRRTLRDFRRYA